MYNFKDPEEMTPEELMRELAQILAQGYLRFRMQAQDLAEEHSNEGANNGVTDNAAMSSIMDKSSNQPEKELPPKLRLLHCRTQERLAGCNPWLHKEWSLH